MTQQEIHTHLRHPSSPPQPDLTTTTTNQQPKKKQLTLLPLIFLIFFEVSGGPYGSEPAVAAAGPLLSILGFTIFPFVWSAPEALITAELSTALPGNGGFVLWADRAFGPFLGCLMGSFKFLSGVINSAAFPVLCADYLSRVAPALSQGTPRTLAILFSNLALSAVNYAGLTIVGYISMLLCFASMMPFLVMSLWAVPRIRVWRWGRTSGKKDWRSFSNTLFWNLNFWDNASTMAGEVDRPQTTFPRALMGSVILTVMGYLVPLMAVTGALDAPQDAWGDGFYADAAADIHRRMQDFEIGTKVLVRVRPERFSKGTVNKLHARRMGPYKIVKKIGSNAYEIDISKDMGGISPVFNVEDLSPYHEPEEFPVTIPGLSPPSSLGDSSSDVQSSPVPPQPPAPPLRRQTEVIEDIVDDEIISTADGGVHRYLVRWRGRPVSDCTWLLEDELFQLDPDALERYRHLYSPEVNSSKPGRVDGDLKVYSRRKKKIAFSRLSYLV